MPNENYRLTSEKIDLEKAVDQDRARLKFLNQEMERIENSKRITLNSILFCRRRILDIDRKLK